MPQKIKRGEIAQHREQLLQDQNYTCGLCGEDLDPDDAVLDHSHLTGYIRRTIHRGCNSFLGKIEKFRRYGVSEAQLKGIAGNLIEYLTAAETEVLHPTHLTPEEKKARAAGRRRKKQQGANPYK